MEICCVCTGNTCRSPMLAALLRHALGEDTDIRIASAGIAAGEGAPANPLADACMQRRGLSLADHRSHQLGRADIERSDRFYCLTPAHAAALQEAGAEPGRIRIVAAEHGGIPDPFGGDARIYEECARLLEEQAALIARALRGGEP